MKKSEIKAGGHYLAKVNGKLVAVRVDAIREGRGRHKGYDLGGKPKGYADATVYDVTNLSTGRKTTFRSAMKFRKEVKAEQVTKGGKTFTKLQDGKLYDGGDCSDPSLTTTLTSAPSAVGGSPAIATTGSKTTEINGHQSGLSRLLKASVEKQVARKPDFGGRPPTAEQQAIIEEALRLQGIRAHFVKTGKGIVLIVEAGAGTGKTSTLQMLEQVLAGLGQYTAFNKALVVESKGKFKICKCNTTHSLAFQAVGKRYSHRLDGPRVRSDVVAKMLGIEDLQITIQTSEGPKPRCLFAGFLASQVTGAIRRYCQSADREIGGGHFKYVDGIDMPTEDGRRTYANNELVREHLLPFARKAWADLSDPDGQLPYNADCYVKVWQLDRPIISCDYLLLDEAQDTAPVMLDIVRQNAEAGAMVILVGDSAQSIYEWRGAVNAMAEFPDAPRKLLSQSFRFGEAIAQLANQVLDQLEERTPLRLKGLPSIPSVVEPVAQPRAILCRTNGGAIGHLLREIGEGRRAFLVGGGADVISFVEAAQALQQGRGTSHPELACFTTWTEVQAYAKSDEGEDLKLMVKLIDDFGAETILAALRGMPKEENADVTISTAHKSKGREWESVKLAADFPTASKCADPDLKLLYVAVTRAKLRLDVSECPFFTGQDAMPWTVDVKPAPEGIVPPTPAAPPAPTGYSWAKDKTSGDWVVRGPAGKTGETVEVVRRDGSRSRKTLGAVVWESEGVATYKVGR